MIQFQCDYNEGAHPLVLDRLVRTNMEQSVGYGEDAYCERARALIREACAAPEADVHFLVGGTQTNVTVIAAALRPYQGVVCAASGHINVHETGAVEHAGHKCLALPATEGKISAEQVDAAIEAHFADPSAEHTVQPAMVYISQPTEVGTIYTKAELEALSRVCRRRDVLLFADGARLGYGLASPECDVTLADMARLCDVFYIGGTKVGALFGEAVVIPQGTANGTLATPAGGSTALARDFRYNLKQNGGMLAKGRLLGLQFEALFTDGLYLEIARHAVAEALRIREALGALGVPTMVESPTNQQFPILPDAALRQLADDFLFDPWGRTDATHTAVRICTSWATRTENVDRLIEALQASIAPGR